MQYARMTLTLSERMAAIVPRRIFLDTCTFQALWDCGGYVFAEDEFPERTDYHPNHCPQVLKRADAADVLDCLRNIFLFDERAQFDWIVSRSSLKEVDDRGDQRASVYVRDIMDHSAICLSENPPGEEAARMAAYLSGPKCGFLSAKDRQLLEEAATAGCNVFLTIEKRLPRVAGTVIREIPLLITTPAGLWALLEPHLKGQ